MGKIIFLLLLIAWPLHDVMGSSIAPAYNFNCYTANLPSNTIYSMLLDKRGYLWLATNSGLLRYDGTDFSVVKGLPSDDIINLYYDPANDVVWPLAFTGAISSVDAQSLAVQLYAKPAYPGAALYACKLRDTVTVLMTNNLAIVKGNSISMRPYNKSIYREYLNANPLPFPIDSFREVDWEVEGAALSPAFTYNRWRFLKNGVVAINKRLYGQRKNKIVQLVNAQKLTDNQGDFIADYAFSGSDLYLAVCGEQGGVFQARDFLKHPATATFTLISEQGFANALSIDNAGNIWYTINEKGLFFIDRFFIDHPFIPLENNIFKRIDCTDDGRLVIYGSGSTLLIASSANPGVLGFRKEGAAHTWPQYRTLFQRAEEDHDASLKDISHDKSVGFTSRSIHLYASNFKAMQQVDLAPAHLGVILGGDRYQDQILFYTNARRLYHYNIATKAWVGSQPLPQEMDLTDLYYLNTDTLIACTQNGVFICDAFLRKKKCISSSQYNKVLAYGHTLYFAGSKELGFIELGRADSVTNFLHTDYLCSHFGILDFDISQNSLHLLTDRGYLNLPRSQLPTIFNPRDDFRIAKICIGQHCSFEPDSMSIPASTKNQQAAVGIQFLYPGNERFVKSYSCTVNGEAENWVAFYGSHIYIPNLSPGTYQLKVKVSRPVFSQDSVVAATFTIKHFFWQTAVFKLIVLVLAIALTVVFCWSLFARKLRKRTEAVALERHVAEIENKAFLNQLNPHFLFNALNTLQDYIIRKDTHNGIIYLQRISAIARSILQFNRTATIPVATEKSFLEKYLFVQQKRYSDKFAYRVDATDDALNLNIPPMLLQPILENAIEHGFASKDQGGLVHVSFSRTTDAVIACVTDNGTGQVEDITSFQDGHALYMINERLNYINKTKQHDTNYIFISANQPTGICITIKIPLPT